MRMRTQIAVIFLVALLALAGGCKKKRPPTPQPQEQAPTISEPAPPQPEPQPQPQPAPSTTTAPSAPTKPPATVKPPKKKAAKKTKPPEPKPESPKSKTVVTNGGTSTEGGQLSAGLPRDQAAHQRQTTTQLQQAAEANLRGVTRTLSSEEQSMVQQIRAYLQQSRAAEADGDTERAYNLAVKARLLSDELVKR
jgi:outer membrane biosynthesis protein TonB